MKKSLTLFFLIAPVALFAQVTTYPMYSNPVLERLHEEHPEYVWGQDQNSYKWGRRDTLSLPFFDDFSTSSVYPDSSKWLNNQVFINAQFPIDPPSINVATFDVLDANGRPYNGTINRNFYGPGDSLTSQPINLNDSAGKPYQLSDSIILSFYYQPNGLGYHLSSSDSIRLFFKSKFGDWIQVWSAGGTKLSQPFEQVQIPIRDSGYLHKGFQFAFTTWTKQVGNANQWHIDYILLDDKRSLTKETHEDYAIQKPPTSLLKNYYQMPYDHYVLNPQGEKADSIYFYATQLDSVTLNIEVRHRDTFGTQLNVQTNFSNNSANIAPRESARRRFEIYPFDNLPYQRPLIIDRYTEIREAGVINAFRANDMIWTQQVFDDYFAHDDGTAEQGFGFDHFTNPENIEGDIAYRFTLNKPDTLYAIGTFFNQAVFDVSREQFTFRVWQSIAEPGSSNTDILLYESDNMNPQYVYQKGRYSIHYLDTTLILPAGDFYIGWHQTSMFNLNVGWDKNSGNHKLADQPSPFLFYKVFGAWSNQDLPGGELMMRPYVGSRREIWLGNGETPALPSSEISIYPNPASEVVHFSQTLYAVQLMDQTGHVILSAEESESLQLTDCAAGVYMIQGRTASGAWVRSKLIIFAR